MSRLRSIAARVGRFLVREADLLEGIAGCLVVLFALIAALGRVLGAW